MPISYNYVHKLSQSWQPANKHEMKNDDDTKTTIYSINIVTTADKLNYVSRFCFFMLMTVYQLSTSCTIIEAKLNTAL